MSKEKETSEMKMLRASYEMYGSTIPETERQLRDALNDDGTKLYSEEKINEVLSELKNAKNTIVEKYVALGGSADDLMSIKPKRARTKYDVVTVGKTKKEDKTPAKKESKKKDKAKNDEPAKIIKKNTGETYIPKKIDNSMAAGDIVNLPSKGKPYRTIGSKLQLAYLTARDENLFVSENLYRDNLLFDVLLNQKIQDEGVDAADLLDGDRDALIIWLRATGYGHEFPITVKDDVSGESFDTVIDLSELRFKDFDLESDENGYFDFTTPLRKDVIKFKFLSHREVKELGDLFATEAPAEKKLRLTMIAEDLRRFADSDTILEKKNKSDIYAACRNIEDWAEDIDDEEVYCAPAITNRLKAHIVSVNGNSNRAYISNYVDSMPVKDSLALRKYITENEPGMDFNIEVEKPESLGGGSQKLFLQFDQFMFLNIA